MNARAGCPIQAQALTESVGDEIGRMISEQQQLEERFEGLVAAQRELRGQPNRAKQLENEVRGRGITGGTRTPTAACNGDGKQSGIPATQPRRSRPSLLARPATLLHFRRRS